jgi:inner membrane protein
MEPITQGLLGAAMGEVAAGKTLGRRAMLWGALVGMSPDLDVLAAPLHEGYGEWLYHRGTTHSLWFGFAVGPAFGWLLWRWRDRARETPLSAWVAVCVLALLTHPILDGFTPYGTQLFAPFWRERFVWNGIGIIDPFYTVPLAAGVFCVASRRVSAALGRRLFHASLVVTTAYVFLGVAWNTYAEHQVESALTAAGERVGRVTVYPTVLQPWLRYFVAHTGDRVLLGWHSPASQACLSWRERATPPPSPIARALLDTWEGRLLTWFADGEIGIDELTIDGGTRVYVDDLRYSWGSSSGRGMWGIFARFDEQSRRVGPVRRFRRGGDNARDVNGLFAAIAGRLPGRAAGWKTLPACRR